MKNNELNLYQKINEVMKKVESVNKGATIEMGKGRTYTAVNHDDVTSLLHKPLADIGIVAMPDMCEVALELVEKEVEYQGKISKKNDYLIKVWASVEFINSDKPDERIKTRAFSYALDSGDKATGKAYSMAIKYAYLKTFMLESCDEEESRDYEKNRAIAPTQSNFGHQKEAVSNQIKTPINGKLEDMEIPFGKSKGKMLSEEVKTNRKGVEWIANEFKGNPKLIALAKLHLEANK
jgi:hypothetical protein